MKPFESTLLRLCISQQDYIASESLFVLHFHFAGSGPIDDSKLWSQHGWELLFRCVRISIRGLVRWSVARSVGKAFIKIDEIWAFTAYK